jgi:hypothetical protein
MKLAIQIQLQVSLELCLVESDKILNLRMKLALQVQLQVRLQLRRVEYEEFI